MLNNIIYSNEYIELIEYETSYFLKVKKSGFTMQELNDIVSGIPRAKFLKFNTVKVALDNKGSIVEIGDKKPLIDLFVSKDKLEGNIFINMSEEEFESADINELVAEIISILNENGITYGFNINDIMTNIKPLTKVVVARGDSPTKGEDAIIKLYEMDQQSKPQLSEDGRVNYYDFNLINRVQEGEWVGERIEPKDGMPGKSVYGEIIPADKGDQLELVYDEKTIRENNEGEKTVLYSKRTGAIMFENNVLTVCNFLEIKGKVSFETGNIDFDGSVNVKESVDDNFTIKANNDIQVLGDMGIGGVDTIESREGNVYIRGGIAGKGKAQIICNGDLYTKFASDCTIECGGSVYIGYYAMNCNITAKEVILDSYNSKIIGGKIKAEVRIVTGQLGNKMDIPTMVEVQGFNRDKVKEEYEIIGVTIDRVKDKIAKLKKITSYVNTNMYSDREERLKYEKYIEEIEYYTNNLKALNEKRKKCMSYLKVKGEGEIVVSKCMFPRVFIKVKHHEFWNSNMKRLPVTYYTDGKELVTI